MGGAVNMASRLESNAKVDSILISHDTYSLIKDKIFCTSQGELIVKGIIKLVTVYEVINLKEIVENNYIIKHNSNGLKLDIDILKIKDKKISMKTLSNAIKKIKSNK